MKISQLFRIWSKSQEKYVYSVSYNSKTSWKRKSAANDAAVRLIEEKRHAASDLEIHEFPIVTEPTEKYPVEL